MTFEWNEKKNQINIRKHGISFADAITVFDDSLSDTIYDIDHSDQENRFLTVGLAKSGKLLIVSHADDKEKNKIRIINARELTRNERKDYEEIR